MRRPTLLHLEIALIGGLSLLSFAVFAWGLL